LAEQDIYVGDNAVFTAIGENEGVIERIQARRSLLVRPPVANIEQVVIVCSLREPPLSLHFLDRLLVLAESRRLLAAICVNKIDLPGENSPQQFDIYRKAGYSVIAASARTGHGISDLYRQLCNKISVFAGQSGTGKSSLINCLQKDVKQKTGSISDKRKIGRHTTRQVSLIPLACGGYVADTPGFSRIALSDIESTELDHCFPEFLPYLQNCRFNSCRHVDEPGCAVKDAVRQEIIAPTRYINYLSFYKTIKEQERRKK